jgi:hypothetical protein
MVQALIGQDEKKEIQKSFKHGLLPIQAESPKSCYV